MTETSAPPLPLAGMRILDFSFDISGPYCTKLLTDAGAEVIKIESRHAPDPLRRWTASGTPLAAGKDGALFQHLNASKRGICLDLESEADRKTFLDLAATADLVIESFAPGTLERFDLGLSTLQAQNPALSLVSITPWGCDGPWAERPATEFTLQAATGSTDHRGHPDRLPVAAGGRIGEWIGGAFAAMGAMFAWLSARNTGRGQHVDLSLFEAMLLTLTYYHDLSSQWREGPLHRGMEVPSIEPAKDGWVGVCTLTGQQWKDFCVMAALPELGADDRYLDGTLRTKQFDLLHERIHPWMAAHSVDEIIELAGLLRIPAAPIGDGRNLPGMDHFVARGVFSNGPGDFLRPRPPFLLEKSALRPFGPAPRLGEHTEEVLREIEHAAPALTSAEGGDALPLEGLRVIELTTFWAGPIAGTHLADLGADVIKVESIQRPDGIRFAGAIPGEQLWEWSPVFAGVNPGKRNVTLQLDSEEGMALLRQLIEGADVLIENFSVRVMDNFGLGWERLHAWNPRLVMLRMPAFGLDGPWRDRAGFAMTVEQVSGMAWITGYEDLPLVVRGACDPLGGLHAVFALLLALEDRRRTGEGQLVEVPLVEGALNIAAEQVIEYSAYGQLLTRAENRGPFAAPQGVYHCAGEDELLALAVATDSQWKALCALMDKPDWATDPRFTEAGSRRVHHDAIDEAIGEWISTLECDACVKQLLDAGIAANALVNSHYVMPNPQLEHREFFQVMRHPVTKDTRYPGLPMRFSGLPRHLHGCPPPTLGQHNDEILGGELGLSKEELTDLRERQIIGQRPSFM